MSLDENPDDGCKCRNRCCDSGERRYPVPWRCPQATVEFAPPPGVERHLDLLPLVLTQVAADQESRRIVAAGFPVPRGRAAPERSLKQEVPKSGNGQDQDHSDGG